MHTYTLKDTPVGPITIKASDDAVCVVEFRKEKNSISKPQSGTVLERAVTQLQEYFAGQRKDFDLPLEQGGTAFQKKAWSFLTKIPFGETRSYGDQAKALKTSPRAVGGANHRNHIAIVVPCHRIVGHRGDMVGYASGVRIKEKLLELERRFA